MAQSDRADRFLKRICQRVSIRSNARKVCPKVEAIRQRISVMANHSLRRIKAVPPLPLSSPRAAVTNKILSSIDENVSCSKAFVRLPSLFPSFVGTVSIHDWRGGGGEGFLVSEQRGLNRWG